MRSQAASASPDLADGSYTRSYANRVLALLLLVYVLNYFDRTIPSILTERIRLEFGLVDFQLGLITSAFTVVYAIAGLPLGRLADRASRVRILGWGLLAWSAFTALNGAVTNFVTFLAVRCGVGIGEASCGPSASSLIGDFFPSGRRARASGILLLGIPLGSMLAAFTIGPLAELTDSWRIPFLLAAVPGIVVAVVMFRIREPRRGAADAPAGGTVEVRAPFRSILAIPTMRWLIVSGVTFQFALNTVTGFFTPLMQRYFHFGLPAASAANGVALGVAGVLGLLVGGWLADRARRRSERARLLLGSGCVGTAGLLVLTALATGAVPPFLFVALVAVAMLLSYAMITTAYSSIHDVVLPHLRGTAIAVYFAASFVLGGAVGTAAVGALSDRFARLAAAGGPLTEALRGQGLHDAMLWTLPTMLVLTAVGKWFGSRRIGADAAAMRASLGTTS
jgi:MFS family permease